MEVHAFGFVPNDEGTVCLILKILGKRPSGERVADLFKGRARRMHAGRKNNGFLANAVHKELEGYLVVVCAYRKRAVIVSVTELLLDEIGGNCGGVYEMTFLVVPLCRSYAAEEVVSVFLGGLFVFRIVGFV